MSELLNAALDYARHGWHVLPIDPADGKRPLGRLARRGVHDATTDLEQVAHWWQVAPTANVAIACGPSGVLALDIDPRNGGDDTFHALEHQLGELPPTVEALTGGGGRHLLFRSPTGPVLGAVGPGVDVKHAGYIVAPPSRHASGRRYAWSVDGHPADLALADLPASWLERIHAKPAKPAPNPAAVALEDDPLRDVPAVVYVAALSGRVPTAAGFVACPFHAGGEEAVPSLKLYGTGWACFGCPAASWQRLGASCLGGGIYEFAALTWGYPLPLRGPAFIVTRDRLHDVVLTYFESKWAA